MGGGDSCCVAGWPLPFVSLTCYPDWGGMGGRGWWLFCLHMGVPCSLTCTHLYALIALQGSLPDIKCESDVNINLLFLEKCKFLNCECLSWWELR